MRKLFLPLLLLLFLLAFGLRLAWARDFDGLYGQDAYAYYNFALSLRESLLSLEKPGAFFWPLAYPLQLILTLSLLGSSAASAQMLSIFLGALLVPLVYSLARLLRVGQLGALLAAFLIAISGQATQSSIVIMSDMPALFWAVLSAVLLWRYMATEKKKYFALAFLALGIAITSRWIYLAFLPVWGITLVVHWRSLRWRLGLLAIAMLCISLLPQFLYSYNSPFPVLNHEWVVSWSPSHFLQQEFVNGDGIFHYPSTNLAFYTAPFHNSYYLSSAFLSLIFLGILRLRSRKLLIFITFGLLLPLLFLMGIPYQNMRFSLVLLPFVALLAAFGADALLHWRFRKVGVGFLGVIMLLGSFQTLIAANDNIGNFIARQQEDSAVVDWAARWIPDSSFVYTFGLTQRLDALDSFVVYELFYETPASLDYKWIRGQNDYLLVNLWEIENQWQGREPYTAFHWLQDNRGLMLLGRKGNYILCLIRG